MAALEVVVVTASSVTSDYKIVNMTAFLFQCVLEALKAVKTDSFQHNTSNENRSVRLAFFPFQC